MALRKLKRPVAKMQRVKKRKLPTAALKRTVGKMRGPTPSPGVLKRVAGKMRAPKTMPEALKRTVGKMKAPKRPAATLPGLVKRMAKVTPPRTGRAGGVLPKKAKIPGRISGPVRKGAGGAGIPARPGTRLKHPAGSRLPGMSSRPMTWAESFPKKAKMRAKPGRKARRGMRGVG